MSDPHSPWGGESQETFVRTLMSLGRLEGSCPHLLRPLPRPDAGDKDQPQTMGTRRGPLWEGGAPPGLGGGEHPLLAHHTPFPKGGPLA